MMLNGSPWWLHNLMARPFTFQREGLSVGVLATLRGVRAGELLNSEAQADALVICDARPIVAAGISYLLKFDRFVSPAGETYSVQESRPSYDGETLTFFKAFVRGGTQ